MPVKLEENNKQVFQKTVVGRCQDQKAFLSEHKDRQKVPSVFLF